MTTSITDLECRVAALELQVIESFKLNTILFNLLLQHDESLKLKYADYLRRIIQTPVDRAPMSPALEQLLRSVREGLLAKPDPELVALFATSHVRPVG